MRIYSVDFARRGSNELTLEELFDRSHSRGNLERTDSILNSARLYSAVCVGADRADGLADTRGAIANCCRRARRVGQNQSHSVHGLGDRRGVVG